MRRPLLLVLFLVLLGIFAVSLFVPGWPAGAGKVPQQALSISKRAYPIPAVEGGGLSYEVTVHNGEPVTLTNVVITDILPSGARWVAVRPPCYRSSDQSYLHCPDLSLPPGGAITVWFLVQVSEGAAQVVNDQYAAGAPGVPPVSGDPVVVPVVTAAPYTPGPYPPPTSSPLPTPVLTPVPTPIPTSEPAEPAPTPTGIPHLVLTQQAPSAMPAAGGEVTLRVAVTNDGTGGAHDVVLALQLPAGLEAQEVTISPDAASEWQGNVLWVAWGYLEAGAAASLEVRAVVGADGVSGGEIVASVPDYGLASQVDLGVAPAVLPPTGPGAAPWWGWFALGGALLTGGWLLLQFVRGREADHSSTEV